MSRALTISQVAECMELRVKGIPWENLGLIFDLSTGTVRKTVRAAERYGYSYWTDNPVSGAEQDAVAYYQGLVKDLEHQVRELHATVLQLRSES